MIFLFDPLSLITPDLGFSFWTLLAFGLFWMIAGKFAIKPMVNSINARSQKIEDELLSAQKARKEFEELQAQNEDMHKQAREERQQMLLEAKKEVEEFKASQINKAKEDAAKILDQAKSEIENQKISAMNELKNEVGSISVMIAEKLVQSKLDNQKEQTDLVEKMLGQKPGQSK